jgi:hypothetical protein
MMTTNRQIASFLEQALSGKEVAQIVLQRHLDCLLEREPAFSATEIERAKRGLHGREASLYNAWIDAGHRIQCLIMDSTITAQAAQIRLLRLLRVLSVVEDNFRIRLARELSPLMVTRQQAKQYYTVLKAGRRANMAQHQISLFWATAYRAWELAPEDLKTMVRAHPEFEEDENEYEILKELAKEQCQSLYEEATAEIAALVRAGKIRFSRNGEDVTGSIVPLWWENCSTQEEADSFEEETMCSLLELVDTALPEWTSWAKRNPAELAPAKYLRTVAVPYDPNSVALDETGSYPELGWNLLERWMAQWETPELIDALREGSQKATKQLRRYTIGRAVVAIFSAETGVNFVSLLDVVEPDLRDTIEEYNAHVERNAREHTRSGPLAELSRATGLQLERIELEHLEPPAAMLETLRGCLRGELSPRWEDAVTELLTSSEKIASQTLN